MVRAGMEAVDSVGLVMAALARQMRLDADLMQPQERMQLMQMALQCCQHKENSWSELPSLHNTPTFFSHESAGGTCKVSFSATDI